MAPVTILSTVGLTKTYGGVVANDAIDFSLPAGRIMALIGPNGAGKSTFVGMLCGRIPATAGKVYFDGEDISGLPAHRRIALGMAYTFQITSIFTGLSIHENVALAVRRRLGNARAAVDAKVADRARQRAGDLSYGHQRILEIAMGLAQEPRLFILDEPTQGLAETEIDSFIDLVKTLAGEATILLIEHNMDVVMKTADYITVFNFGEILAEGTPEEIRRNEAVQAAYLGTVEHA
jgi:branched-chain amino acid transport system ATP-binding protein